MGWGWAGLAAGALLRVMLQGSLVPATGGRLGNEGEGVTWKVRGIQGGVVRGTLIGCGSTVTMNLFERFFCGVRILALGVILFGGEESLRGDWYEKQSGVEVDLKSVVSGHAGWVVVGDMGAILASQGGSFWSRASVDGTPALEGVTYGNGRYVAVGWGGVVMRSTDGLNWTMVETGSTTNFWGVAFGGGRYVAVGDGGAVLSSTNGTVWAEGQAGEVTLESVVYGGDRFVAVGVGGVVQVLVDGETDWVAGDSGQVDWLEGVTFGNGVFVAVGAGGRVLTSTDGLVWEEQYTPVTAFLTGVGFGESGFRAVGEGGVILNSTDGELWLVEGIGQSAFLFATASDTGDWVIVGTGGVILSTLPTPSIGNFRLIEPRFVSGLGFEFKVEGLENGQEFVVQVLISGDLADGEGWVDLATRVATEDPQPFLHVDASLPPIRYYRVILR